MLTRIGYYIILNYLEIEYNSLKCDLSLNFKLLQD